VSVQQRGNLFASNEESERKTEKTESVADRKRYTPENPSSVQRIKRKHVEKVDHKKNASGHQKIVDSGKAIADIEQKRIESSPDRPHNGYVEVVSSTIDFPAHDSHCSEKGEEIYAFGFDPSFFGRP